MTDKERAAHAAKVGNDFAFVCQQLIDAGEPPEDVLAITLGGVAKNLAYSIVADPSREQRILEFAEAFPAMLRRWIVEVRRRKSN